MFTCPNCNRKYPEYYKAECDSLICYECYLEWFFCDRYKFGNQQEEMLFLISVGGYSKVDAAKLLGVHRNTVSNWLHAYKAKGELPDWAET
jgi:hypothetical protein